MHRQFVFAFPRFDKTAPYNNNIWYLRIYLFWGERAVHYNGKWCNYSTVLTTKRRAETRIRDQPSAEIFKQSMGAGNRVGIGLSYRRRQATYCT